MLTTLRAAICFAAALESRLNKDSEKGGALGLCTVWFRGCWGLCWGVSRRGGRRGGGQHSQHRRRRRRRRCRAFHTPKRHVPFRNRRHFRCLSKEKNQNQSPDQVSSCRDHPRPLQKKAFAKKTTSRKKRKRRRGPIQRFQGIRPSCVDSLPSRSSFILPNCPQVEKLSMATISTRKTS